MKEKTAMFISFSFSGGVSHKDDVPKEKQAEVAGKIAKLVSAALETNAASGSGSVTVGEATASVSVTTTYSL
jgi:hypothetical protein